MVFCSERAGGGSGVYPPAGGLRIGRGGIPPPRAGNPAEVLPNHFPQKIVLAKPSPHFAPPHCPNTWRAEPRKKNILSFFKRNFIPAKSEMQGVFFFGVAGILASAWGFNMDSAKRKSVFLGERIFRFASADFPPAGGVWGGIRAGFGLGVFAAEFRASKTGASPIKNAIFQKNGPSIFDSMCKKLRQSK